MTGSPRRYLAVMAAPLLAITLTFAPTSVSPAAAATNTKVVIVVGPVGDPTTADYISAANTAAATFRKYTSNVTAIYSPHATWSAVSSALQGANVVLYLGHGNGFPSPYATSLNPKGMDGFGLNATDNNGNYNWSYYGEWYIANYVNLAPNAVVLLSRLCYASGNNEWGAGNPSLSTAKQRIDNYAIGFLESHAKAVIADGIGDITYYIDALFTAHSTIDSVFKNAPNRHANYVTWTSSRASAFTSVADVGTYSWVPDGDQYYRSMVSIPSLSTDAAIGAAATSTGLTGRTIYDAVNVRSGPSTGYGIVATIASAGTSFSVTGPIATDSSGRTWAPVRTSSGATGYTITQYSRFTGSAVATLALNMRSSAPSGSVIVVVPQGARFSVITSTTDASARMWYYASYGGYTGYVAAWYSKP